MRERIDLAFHIMDREYGVTRLLDPEGKNPWHPPSCHISVLSSYLQHKQETDNLLFVSCFQIRQGVVAGLVAFLPSQTKYG